MLEKKAGNNEAKAAQASNLGLSSGEAHVNNAKFSSGGSL
jgi:hypothetical protein